MMMKFSIHRLFAFLASVIVTLVLVRGFFLAGSPVTGRSQQLDERRLEDLRMIQNEITLIVYGTGYQDPTKPPVPVRPLPSSLEEVQTLAFSTRPNITDPETNALYEYRILGAVRYELCATFAFARDLAYDVRWNHPAGRQCFTFDASERTKGGEPLPKGIDPVR